MLRICFLLLFLLHQITCTEYVSNQGSDFFWEEVIDSFVNSFHSCICYHLKLAEDLDI